MQSRLVGLQEEMKTTAKQANGIFSSFLGFGQPKGSEAPEAKAGAGGRSSER